MSGLTLSFRVDVQGLLDPISRERPAGESLRYEGTYDQIQEARREDDQTLSQGIYKARLKRADWEADEAICVEALERRTKDSCLFAAIKLTRINTCAGETIRSCRWDGGVTGSGSVFIVNLRVKGLGSRP